MLIERRKKKFTLWNFVSYIGESPEYIGWKFVALYYSALHYGDAFIAKKLGMGPILFLIMMREEIYMKFIWMKTHSVLIKDLKAIVKRQDISQTRNTYLQLNFLKNY